MPALVTSALWAIVLFLFLSGAASFILMAQGSLAMRRLARESPREDNPTLLKSRLVPAVSMIVATRDSGADSRAMVRLLAGLYFGDHEVVLALDGASGAELKLWSEEFHLAASLRRITGALPMGNVNGVLEARDPIRLTVIALEPGGRALALNAAVNAAQSPLIGLFGAECEFDPDTLLRLIPPILEDPEGVIAVCGVAPAETRTGMVSQFASLEFLRGWLSRQAAFSGWNMLTPTPGSAMLIRRDSILQAGGFRAEALDLFLRLHMNARASKQPYRIAFVKDSGSRQPAPNSLAELRASIARDQRAVVRALRTAALPLWLRAGVLLVRVVRPLLETIAYLLTVVGLIAGWVAWPLAVLALLSTAGLGMLLSMAAVSFRELAEFQGSDPARLARLFFAAIPENLGFHQLRNLWLIVPWGRSKQVDW